MDEVRRFLRFTLPGMASLCQLLLAIYITRSETVLSILQEFDSRTNLIGGIIALFVTSGAIGYILASIYHPLYWTIFSWASINHLTVIKELISQKKLLITNFKGNLIAIDDLKKRDAWTILTYYWYSNVEESNELKGLSNITDRLTDFTHAHGATFLGTALGLLVWLFWFSNLCTCRSWAALFYWFFLLFIYGSGHRLSNTALGSMANAAVLSHMGKVGRFPIVITGINKK